MPHATGVHPADVRSGSMRRAPSNIEGPAEISGFSVRTVVKDTIVGEYGSQVTRKSAETPTPGTPADLKEARIGSITTPSK
jgi:hypothetical protein